MATGSLVSQEGSWQLILDGPLLVSSATSIIETVDGQVLQTMMGQPDADVRDHSVRVILGQLDEGPTREVSLLDGQLVNVAWVAQALRGGAQDFKGRRILRGAHVRDMNEPCLGVRWTLPFGVARSTIGEPAQCAGGVVETWQYDGKRGLSVVLDDPQTLSHLGDLTTHRFDALFAIASGIAVRPIHREVLLGSTGRWHSFGTDRDQESVSHPFDFINPQDIDLQAVARWADQSSHLGTLPFVVSRERQALQPDAHALSAALEGLHRHLNADQMPFRNLPGGVLKSARNAAVKAGVESLLGDGWEDEEYARKKFSDAVAFVGQISYAERLRELLPGVASLAPGMFGPELEGWIKHATKIRNEEGHQLGNNDDFGEQEVSSYFVFTESAKWALRLAMLLTVFPEITIRLRLRESLSFAYSLANIDNERHWQDFSCLKTFQEAEDVQKADSSGE